MRGVEPDAEAEREQLKYTTFAHAQLVHTEDGDTTTGQRAIRRKARTRAVVVLVPPVI
jgi:hypothetical protein